MPRRFDRSPARARAEGRPCGAALHGRSVADVEDLKAANDYAERIIDTVRSPLLVLTSDLRLRSANRAFYEAFHIPSDRAANQPFEQVVQVSKDAERLRTVLAQLLAEGAAPQEIEIECIRPGVGARTIDRRDPSKRRRAAG